MTEKWYRVTDRFSIGVTPGVLGLGITYYPTPAKRHHRVITHWVYLRVIFAWHRRKGVTSAKVQETPSI
jgi:hypothetical protein